MRSKLVVVTGASGFLGMKLARSLIAKGLSVIAVARNVEALEEKLSDILQQIKIVDSENIDKIPFEQVDYVVHCAFTRSSTGHEIASSLFFQQQLIKHIANADSTANLINVSSQGIYGRNTPPPWKESIQPDPDYLYALGKFSAEVICDSLALVGANYTSLRLAGITGAFDGLKPEVTSRFVTSALKGLPIEIHGGTQVFSSIDLEDVVDGIVSLINNTDPNMWDRVYNLGNLQSYSIVDIANTVKKVAPDFVNKEVDIRILETDEPIRVNAGMDSTALYALTNWTPKKSLEQTVLELFKFLQI